MFHRLVAILWAAALFLLFQFGPEDVTVRRAGFVAAGLLACGAMYAYDRRSRSSSRRFGRSL